MRREQTKKTLKLRLLALVLALALIWYSLNPAPRSVISKKPEAEPPDEKKRNLEPLGTPSTLLVALTYWRKVVDPALSQNIDEDDFEWPEFIDG